MITVIVKNNNIEKALRQLKKIVKESKLLIDLRKKEYWLDLEVLLFSDHGSRIIEQNKNAYVSIFAAKTRNISPGLKEDKVTINYLFHKLNN